MATVRKAEVSRVARRAVRGELVGLNKAAGAHRAEIAVSAECANFRQLPA